MLIGQVYEDISGNCFIENPCAPLKDPRTEVVRFARNVDQDHILGIYTSTEIGVQPQSDLGLLKKIEAGDFVLEDLHGEVLHFPTQCPDCGTNCQTNMKVTSILYDFQQELKRKIVLLTIIILALWLTYGLAGHVSRQDGAKPLNMK